MTEEQATDAVDESYEPIEGIDGDEFEEICSEEVDRVVGILEDLIPTVDSENIKSHLEEAMNAIYFLVYDESDAEGEDAAEGEDEMETETDLELEEGESLTEAA